jgi:RNA polymerase sigma factor (sigma-70 family)
MDTDRFKQDVLPLKNKLFRFASGLLNDREDARDAIQEVFEKLWKIRDELSRLNSLEAFAMKVTKNHCLDKIKSRRTVSLNPAGKLLYEHNEYHNTERQLELKDSVVHIKKLMSALPEQQKMIMLLRDIEGYEYEEIEQVLEINLNTIRVNLSRARKKIREMYLKSLNNGPEKSKSLTG